MKTLEFWQHKWEEAFHVFAEHESSYSSARALIRYEYKTKLKKLHGHGLNLEYTGFKIHKRRAKWLKARLVNRTKMAMHRKEMLRLARTKLDFFERRIIKMGGAVPKELSWRYKNALRWIGQE